MFIIEYNVFLSFRIMCKKSKSMVQCRSVSKAWKALIDGSEFIGDYSLRHALQPQRHLARYEDQTVTSRAQTYLKVMQHNIMKLIKAILSARIAHQRFLPTRCSIVVKI